MAEDLRIPDLPLKNTVSGEMVIPVYDPINDTTFKMTVQEATAIGGSRSTGTKQTTFKIGVDGNGDDTGVSVLLFGGNANGSQGALRYKWDEAQNLYSFEITYNYTGASTDVWNEFGESDKFDSDFTVYLAAGKSFGKYTNLQIVPANGKSAKEVILMAAQDVQPPNYQAPTGTQSVTLSTNAAVPNEREVGEYFTFKQTATYTQRDGGALTSLILERNRTSVLDANGANVSSPHTYPPIQLTESEEAFRAIFHYAQGPIKNNDAGAPDERGRIGAGTITTTEIKFRAHRKGFFGFDVASNSAQARTLTGRVHNPKNGTTFNINIPAGAPRVEILYPAIDDAGAAVRDISSIKYVEDSNKVITANFVKQPDITIEGANGYVAVTYKRFVYVPVEPFPFASTYNVTI